LARCGAPLPPDTGAAAAFALTARWFCEFRRRRRSGTTRRKAVLGAGASLG